MITVRDVWRGVFPPRTELLAGGSGLERHVEWATVLRTRPPAFDAVRGGELALVPVRSIRLLDDRLDLVSVIQSFADKGGVAVAIVGVPAADALRLADQLMLPLLQLPDGCQLAELHQAAVRYILDQRTELHEREQQLRSELTELALDGAGGAAIIDRLAALTGHSAVLEDATGAIVHSAPPEAVLPTVLGSQIAELQRWAETISLRAADPPVRELALPGGGARVVSPVAIRDGVGGFVSVFGAERELGQVARIAAARAASACAIELDRERAVLKAREDLEGELLGALVSGDYTSEQAALQRADRLGVPIRGGFQVMLLWPPARSSPAQRDRLLATVQAVAARRAPAGSLVGWRDDAVVVVAPAELDPSGARRLYQTLHREASLMLAQPPLSGVGRIHQGVAGVRTSYREARQAVSIGGRLAGDDRVRYFADLGLHRLLFALEGHAELGAFFSEHAAALAEYDQRTRAGLLGTLEAFFACHGSPTETAGRLHLHRNTVLYRLHRIEQIAGVDLRDPDTRLVLQLCLKVRDVLTAGPVTSSAL